jgi:hypothetical protein
MLNFAFTEFSEVRSRHASNFEKGQKRRTTTQNSSGTGTNAALPVEEGRCSNGNRTGAFSEVAPAVVPIHTISKEGGTIRKQIQARLEELKQELETGQAELQKVEMQRTYLHETVLRISGAVQVLEDLLREGQSGGRNRSGPDDQLRKE